MPGARSGSGESGLQVSGPLSLGSTSPSAHSPVEERKPDLERHISHIPQDSDDDEAGEDPNASPGLKAKLKKLKHRVAHGSREDESDAATAPSDYTEKRHDSGNATSDLEITPGLSIPSSAHISSEEVRAKTPILERHISSVGPDGHLQNPAAERPRARSPKLERHISGIPQEDYDSDREAPLGAA